MLCSPVSPIATRGVETQGRPRVGGQLPIIKVLLFVPVRSRVLLRHTTRKTVQVEIESFYDLLNPFQQPTSYERSR